MIHRLDVPGTPGIISIDRKPAVRMGPSQIGQAVACILTML